MDPEAQKLLALQEVDLAHKKAAAALKRAPLDLEKIANEEARERAALDEKEAAFKALEVRRKEIDGALQDAEAQVVKYKTQQLQVKKNDEYQALTHEIDALGKRIAEYEEEEIGLMLEIDTAREELEKERVASAERMAALARERDLIEQNRKKIEGEVADLEARVAAAREPVAPAYLAAYDAVQKRHPRGPWVSPVEDGRCQGCHLKVSGETVSALRHPEAPVTCDQCGRLVYAE